MASIASQQSDWAVLDAGLQGSGALEVLAAQRGQAPLHG
jgi:hypothetical protein